MVSMSNSSNSTIDDGAFEKLTDFLDLYGRAEGVAVLTTLAAFSVVGVVGNSLALKVFFSRLKKTASRTLRSRYNVFTCALAALDLFVCAVWIPCDVLLTLRLITNDVVCRAIGFCSHAAVIFASFIHFGICLERYYAVCKPLHPFTTLHVRAMMSCFAVVSSGLSVPAVFAYSVSDPTPDKGPKGCHYQRDSLLGRYYNVGLAAVLSSVVAAVLITYGIMFRLIVKRVLMKPELQGSWHADQSPDMTCSTISLDCTNQRIQVKNQRRSNSGFKQRISSSSRLAFMFFAVTLFFYLCWLPYFLIVLNVIALDIFLLEIHFLTNCASFIIYLAFTRRIRQETIEKAPLNRKQPIEVVISESDV